MGIKQFGEIISLQRFQKYIFYAVFKYTLAFFLGLNGLSWFAQFFKISKGISGGASLTGIAFLSLVSLIPMSYYLLSIALILACVYRYMSLIQDKERDVFYSSGIEPWSLAWPSVKIVLYLIILLYGVSFWGGQKIASYIQRREQQLKQVLPHHWLTPGVFFSIGNATLYIHNKRVDGTLEGILLHEQKFKRTLVFSGKYGNISQDGQDLVFKLYNGTCHIVPQRVGKAPHVMSFKTYIVRVPHQKKILLTTPKPQGLTLNALWKRIQGADPKFPWIRELYTRCVFPLWMLPNVLWITWVTLTSQSVRVGLYYRYGLLFFGLMVLQAVPLAVVYTSFFWAICLHTVGCIPGILWIKLILQNRTGTPHDFYDS
ncbi:LptF/LptG family permease [Holospora curviuscula]|uniref:Putative permease YjgP/YjgQ family protein n=1 Tax=Holospora curviuscula TaxID=1082868 RepID=A0A2S5RAM9_9PROT|nr:LptF/LptG family permease [Holospora curviuscula]PPE04175.1 putative permease YjgP/YjgQ family protein [Holospora curviuscula]